MPVIHEPEYRSETTYDPNTKIWSGLKATPVYGPQDSVGKAVLEVLLRDPEHISQICQHNGKIYTNAEIASLSIRVAQHFQKLKIPQCEVVGIVAGNTDYLVPLLFGTLLSGLIVSPLDPGIDKVLLKQAYSNTRPSVIFTVGSAYKKVKECLIELNIDALIYTINDHQRGVPEITEFLQETGDEAHFKPEPLKYGYEQHAAILRSSGTTGIPKACCISHASLLNVYSPKMESDEILLRTSTIFWVSGLNRLVCSYLRGITSVINEPGCNGTTIMEAIQKYKITFLYIAPYVLLQMLDSPNFSQIDFSSLREIHTGGFAIPYSFIERAKVYMPKTKFHTVYGTTEACGTLSTGPCSPTSNAGKIVPNFQLKIIDEAGNNLGVGEIGEICSKGIFPWSGYHKNPEQTAKVYKNGWILSGDLGYVDEAGFVYVADRINDILKYKGHVIYPTKIESIIAELPDVLDVCVCGVTDENDGQLVAACLVKSEDSKLTAEDVYEYVSKRVEDYKNLRGGVYFTNVLPKTLTGKPLRFRCSNTCEIQRRVSFKELNNNSQ